MLVACSGENTRLPNIGTDYNATANLPAESPFRKQPAGTVLNFFKWYRSNVGRLKKIELVTKTATESGNVYAVNFTGTETYLAEMQKSGFVSEEYIDHWREYFKKCDEALKKTPQAEGPVKGLDIDLVMLAKDYDEDLAKIEQSTVDAESIANDQGTVTLALPTVGRLKVKIAKQDSKWMISDIKDMRSALDQAQND
jgi:hypothetical protein